jgi:hypothetical protein
MAQPHGADGEEGLQMWWVKVKLSLCLTKHHAVKTYGGVEVQLDAFVTLVLDRSEWSASRLGHFTSRETAPGTQSVGGWVDPRAGMDAVAKRKNSLSLPRIEPWSHNSQLSNYTHWAILPANILNKQSPTVDRAWGLGEGLTTTHRKRNQLVTKCHTGARNWRAVVNTVMNLRVP